MGRDAETAMIDAAERIAAEEGLGAMSLRAVQAAAGQRNKSAAQYHFGSRDGLIEAIAARRMAPINRRRAELLDSAGASPSLAALVEVLVRPTAEATLGGGPSHWARFVRAGIADPTVAEVVERRLESQPFRAASRMLLDSMDELPDGVARRRLSQVIGLIFSTLAAFEAESLKAAPGDVIADLISVCTAVLTAPVGEA